jgi:hypothetical protein
MGRGDLEVSFSGSLSLRHIIKVDARDLLPLVVVQFTRDKSSLKFLLLILASSIIDRRSVAIAKNADVKLAKTQTPIKVVIRQ